MTRPQPSIPGSQPLILASSSPRRRELLTEAGYQFTVLPPPPDIECGVCSESGPAGVAELAFRKAASVVRSLQGDLDRRERAHTGSPGTFVLAADTVAECDGFVLGKPQDQEHARAMLRQLSGREHRVLTGMCLWRLGSSQPLVRVAATTLRMDPLSDAQIDEYLASGQWDGKAGAFGYQDRLGWVHIVEGSESNVVGLPMEMLAEMLSDLQFT
jgi:septum formation protein